MKKCMIEVIKTTFDEELAMDYGLTGPCPMHYVGQVFYADHAKPEGFCDEAWKAIYQYVFALAHMEKGAVLYGDWIQIPGVSINACSDGIRTVVFKITRTEEDADPSRGDGGLVTSPAFQTDRNLEKGLSMQKEAQKGMMRSSEGEEGTQS